MGKGSILLSVFGHNEHVFYDPMIIQTWLNEIQFALGDLDIKTEALIISEERKDFKPQ